MPSFSFTVLSPDTSPDSLAVAAAATKVPRNIKLTDDNDFDLSTGNLQLLSGTDSIPQDIRLALSFFLGEWYLDRSVGIPYFEDVLVKNPDPNVLQSVFRRAIAARPGVNGVDAITLTQDSETRKLSLAFRASTDAGLLVINKGF